MAGASPWGAARPGRLLSGCALPYNVGMGHFTQAERAAMLARAYPEARTEVWAEIGDYRLSGWANAIGLVFVVPLLAVLSPLIIPGHWLLRRYGRKGFITSPPPGCKGGRWYVGPKAFERVSTGQGIADDPEDMLPPGI